MAKLEEEMPFHCINLLPVSGITPKVHTNTDLMVVMIYRSMAWSLARVLCEVESFSVLLLLETHLDRLITMKRPMGVPGAS